jgi:hypothetical protein
MSRETEINRGITSLGLRNTSQCTFEASAFRVHKKWWAFEGDRLPGPSSVFLQKLTDDSEVLIDIIINFVIMTVVVIIIFVSGISNGNFVSTSVLMDTAAFITLQVDTNARNIWQVFIISDISFKLIWSSKTFPRFFHVVTLCDIRSVHFEFHLDITVLLSPVKPMFIVSLKILYTGCNLVVCAHH